jgi:DNA-binding HxlR family transcriptional regulator
MSGTSAEETHDVRRCDRALAHAFSVLGKRWNGMILGTLAAGPIGFAELRRALDPITDSVLSDRLAELVTADLVNREITDSRPPGVSYTLTPAGQALTPVLNDLARWASARLARQV